MTEKSLRIGLAEVVPTSECDVLDGAKGAFVNVLAVSHDENEFIKLVTDELRAMGLQTLTVEDIDLYADRSRSRLMEEDIWELAQMCEATGKVGVGIFFRYDFDESTN